MNPGSFYDEGMLWEGTRAELDAWKHYKLEKAVAFVRLGYSVEWYPDADGWFNIYHPQRDHARTPEHRAAAKFFSEASRYGIDGGKVSKLSIVRSHTDLIGDLMGRDATTSTILFNYDRGPDVDRLNRDAIARKLYNDVLHLLN